MAASDQVPRLAELLFKLVTPARERAFVLGDLAEEFASMLRSGSGPVRRKRGTGGSFSDHYSRTR